MDTVQVSETAISKQKARQPVGLTVNDQADLPTTPKDVVNEFSRAGRLMQEVIGK